MEISELRNPYDYANPVRDVSIFAGRDDALAKLTYLLEQAGSDRPVAYVAIHGKRAAGKTSLLNMTEIMARKRQYITARVDLVASDSSPRAFFTKVYEELIGAISQAIELKAPDGQEITPRMIRRIINGHISDSGFPLEFPESVAGRGNESTLLSEMALRADFEYLSEQVGRPIVLLIDEAQVIADQEHVLSVLRTMGMRLQGYVFIIAGTTDLVPRINQVFGHLLRQFELIAVERYIEISDVLDCISHPLSSLGLRPESCFHDPRAIANDLMHLTDGNPYEIQLYCHVMFARWQDGAAPRMALSTECLDDVRVLLEAGTEVQKHPMLTKIRAMSAGQLSVLNILCASLGHATIDELWAAHCLAGEPDITREDLDLRLDQFIKDEVLEVNGTVQFCADHFEEIFVRLWTLKKITRQRHPQLISHLDLRHVLTRNLEYLICDIAPDNLKLLSTCCYGMRPARLNRGLSELETLSTSEKLYYTVVYLHEAIVKSNISDALDLTEITFSYNGTEATRWLYASDTSAADLEDIAAYRNAVDRVHAVGGELRCKRTRVPLKPWPEVLDWLVSRKSSASDQKQMSNSHLNASIAAYSNDDIDTAVNHLDAAFRLRNSWLAANNIAYIMLKTDKYRQSLEWSEKAFALGSEVKDRALSLYNAAMALVQLDDYTNACSRLAEASTTLATLPFPDHICIYLFIPEFENNKIILREKARVNLPEAVANAANLIDAATRLRGTTGSTN